MTMIADNLQRIHDRITQTCDKAGRSPDSVALLAVSKTFGAEAVAQAHAAGQTAFGENYIQEAVEKITALAHLPLQWHCIGPIQSNKTRLVAEHFDWVQTIDRLKIAQRLSEQRPPHLAPLQVCIQVNMDGGPTKSGVAPEDALALARAVSELPRMHVRGIMCIPEPAPDFVAACAVFARARALFDQMNAAGMGLDTLSMGMSNDLEAAITSGSTLVRVGSAIFGARNYAASQSATVAGV
jgi:pyridoxal phosphate enzyme (YggS family)